MKSACSRLTSACDRYRDKALPGSRSNSVSVIETKGNTRIADIRVGELPWGVVIR